VLLIQSLRDDSLKALLLERVSRDPTFYSELAASLAQVPEEEKRVWRASKRSEMGREEVTALGTQGVAGLIREAREFREAGDVLKAPGVSAVRASLS